MFGLPVQAHDWRTPRSAIIDVQINLTSLHSENINNIATTSISSIVLPFRLGTGFLSFQFNLYSFVVGRMLVPHVEPVKEFGEYN